MRFCIETEKLFKGSNIQKNRRELLSKWSSSDARQEEKLSFQCLRASRRSFQRLKKIKRWRRHSCCRCWFGNCDVRFHVFFIYISTDLQNLAHFFLQSIYYCNYYRIVCTDQRLKLERQLDTRSLALASYLEQHFIILLSSIAVALCNNCQAWNPAALWCFT